MEIPENEVVFYIRKGKAIPLCKSAESTSELDTKNLELIGTGDEYLLYTDDGMGFDIDNPENFVTLKK